MGGPKNGASYQMIKVFAQEQIDISKMNEIKNTASVLNIKNML
jgi:hypothetical protein